MALLKPWVAAARPRTWPAAVVPVVVGGSTAWADDAFVWQAFWLALAGALAIQIAANFANDVSDARRGADPSDRLGPPRMVATGAIGARTMWVATWTAIGVAALAGIGLAILTGPLVLVIGAASIMAMLGYVGGPVPYGYRGLGEVFVFVFFGLVATAGSRYVHDGSVDGASWLLAVPVGLMAAAILVVNNLRDLETDRRVGKRTLAVKMGDHGTRTFYRSLLAISYAWVGGGVATGVVSPWTLLILATVPFALRLGRLIGNVSDRASMAPALGATARLHLVMGVLLALGTIIGSL